MSRHRDGPTINDQLTQHSPWPHTGRNVFHMSQSLYQGELITSISWKQ